MPTYKEILQLEYDKKQLQFAIDGSLIINQKIMDEKAPIDAIINNSKFWICPFCLETSNKFTIEAHGLVKCPNCENLMKVKTILFVKDCSNKQYANWVFNYRLSGFFKKINFEKWTKKLKELGIVYEFWDEYKKLKGINEQEEKIEQFTPEQRETIIIGIISEIKKGLLREDIIIMLLKDGIEFTIDSFDYFYREAKIKIKNGV
jgi:hypothetical protein